MSDRSKAEESRRQTDWASALVQFSGEAIIGVRPGGNVMSWNPAAERMFGYAKEEILGRSILLVTPESHIEDSRAVLARVSAGRPVEHLETLRVRKDGTVFPVSLTVAPVFAEEGAIVGAVAIATDLTQLRQGFLSGVRLAAIVAHSDEAIIDKTLEGVITSWNPGAQRIYGYTSEEAIGQTIELLVPKDRVDELKDILAEIRDGQSVEQVETIRVRKDGRVFPARLTVSPIRVGNTVIGVSTMVRDLSEQKQGQYARSLIEAGLDPMVTITPEGKIADVNLAMVKVTGVLRGELIGSDFSQWFTEPGSANEGYRQAFAHGSSIDFPLTFRHVDGTLTEVRFNFSVYRDVAGEVLGVLAAARDVTSYQRAERELRQLADLLEFSAAAITSETDAIIGGTLEGIITSWNPGAARMFGYSREEMIGQPFRILVPKDELSEIVDIETQARNGQASDWFESVRVRRDGSTFPVSFTSSPITDANGAVMGVCTIVRDVTGKKRDQREIADWREKAFKWMEDLEQAQRLSVQRDFERELELIDLQQEIERLRRLVPLDPREPEDEQ